MQQFSLVSVLVLLCAVDWQTPDGILHSGSFVYSEADATALVQAQQLSYPAYIFTIRCVPH